MNVYRITEEVGQYADGAEYYIVLAHTEEQAREMIRENIRKIHQEHKDKGHGFVSAGERIEPGNARWEPMVQENLEFSLEHFENNFPHVEVTEAKEGIAFTGY